ncbi:hypothetical protein ScPMuIL_010859 [Solemya velum]
MAVLTRQGASSQRNLTSALFDDYDNGVTPVCNGVASRVNVTLDIALRQIVDLDEPMQIVTLNLWVRMIWTDCRLQWREADFEICQLLLSRESSVDSRSHLIRQVQFLRAKFYVKASILIIAIGRTESRNDQINVHKETRDTSEYKAAISSGGQVRYNYPTLTESKCKVNVKYFPFDKQTCKLIFGSWAYSGFEIDFESKNPTGDMSSIDENVEWDVLEFPAKAELLRLPHSAALHSYLRHWIAGIPVARGSREKVAVGITILLSQAVFLLLVGEKLPPSSETLPLIAIYFDFAMFLVCLACVSSVVVLNFHYTNSRSVPACMRTVFLGFLAKLVFVKTKENQNITFTERTADHHFHETECVDSPKMPIKSRYPAIGNGIHLPPISSEEENRPVSPDDNVSFHGISGGHPEPSKPSNLLHSINDWQLIAQLAYGNKTNATIIKINMPMPLHIGYKAIMEHAGNEQHCHLSNPMVFSRESMPGCACKIRYVVLRPSVRARGKGEPSSGIVLWQLVYPSSCQVRKTGRLSVESPTVREFLHH